jgi:hypothetical protein
MNRTTLLRSLLAGFILLVSGGLALLLKPSPSAFPPRPQPNGYDALVRAAGKIIPQPYSRNEATQAETEEWLAKNRDALAELRKALPLPAVVTVQMSEQWIKDHSPELRNLTAGGYALNTESVTLSKRGDTDGAVLASVDLLHLGEAAQRGGVLIDFLVGSACEVMAVRQMTNLLNGLSVEQCKLLVRSLEDRESQRDTFAKIQQREKEWSWKTYGLVSRVRMMIETRSLHPGEAIKALITSAVDEYNLRVRETRLTLLRIAARSYELDHGRKPGLAKDLVPTYVQSVPQDPVTGQQLALP